MRKRRKVGRSLDGEQACRASGNQDCFEPTALDL